MTLIDDEEVYGERIGDLVPALRAFYDAAEWGDDGMFQVSTTVERDVAEPFARALKRAEAELLLEEADSIGSEQEAEERTEEQRAADALVRIADAINEEAAWLRRRTPPESFVLPPDERQRFIRPT